MYDRYRDSVFETYLDTIDLIDIYLIGRFYID